MSSFHFIIIKGGCSIQLSKLDDTVLYMQRNFIPADLYVHKATLCTERIGVKRVVYSHVRLHCVVVLHRHHVGGKKGFHFRILHFCCCCALILPARCSAHAYGEERENSRWILKDRHTVIKEGNATNCFWWCENIQKGSLEDRGEIVAAIS